jgi:hypothetical protein
MERKKLLSNLEWVSVLVCKRGEVEMRLLESFLDEKPLREAAKGGVCQGSELYLRHKLVRSKGRTVGE